MAAPLSRTVRSFASLASRTTATAKITTAITNNVSSMVKYLPVLSCYRSHSTQKEPQQQQPAFTNHFDVNADVFTTPGLSNIAHILQGKKNYIKNSRDEEEGESQQPVVLQSAALPVTTFGAASVADSLFGPTTRWWLSECISVGSVKMGLPGIAAQVVFLAPMQAANAILKEKDTGKLPLLPYSAMLGSGILWTAYGLMKDDSAIWAANVPAILFASYYTAVFYMNCPKDANWLPGTRNLHLIGLGVHTAGVLALSMGNIVDQSTAINILGMYGCLVVAAMFGGPLSAIKEVIETKNTKSIPFAFTVATFINCILWTSYGYFLIDDLYVWGPNLLGLLSACVQLGLFAKFGFGKD